MKKRRNRVTVRNPDTTPEPASPRTSLSLGPDKSSTASLTKTTAVERAPLIVKDVYNGPVVPRSMLIIAALASSVILVWSYWPTWVSLVTLWEREPDYSHGWFVIPIAAYLLWSFKDSMPPVRSTLSWGGLVMLGCVAMVRIFARFAYFDFLDGWTIPLTAIGLAWVFGGKQWAYWALPALGFLFFMIPLPFRIENELSQPLQWIATNASCYTLQLLGQPAIAEGTTILLGDQILEVERACSGLRIFMGVFALAYVYAVLVRRSWWERILLVLAAVPIALISNAARIIATGLCFQWFSGETARHFSHDLAGYVMIVFAAGLFGLTLLYLRWLVQDAQTMDQASLQRV
ncbi:MAG: exosortase/archaeosortase family protein [Pirellula sp.]